MCFLYITRVVLFKDQLNFVNTSGIVVVFMGVLLYKSTLHMSKTEAEADTSFGMIDSGLNEEEVAPHRAKQYRDDMNLDPDAPTFTIDDEDIGDEILTNGDALSALVEQG